MEMRAYLSDYVPYAQRILGDMLDFAVNTCDMDIDEYFGLFTVSSVSTQFQNGNPTYIAGKTGCELVREVIADAGMEPLSLEDEMYLDKSPEYWAGWALAYYQWYTCRTFIKIHKAVSLKKIVSMYDIYHEMDITHFIDTINELWDNYYNETNLKRLRKLAGLSQRELSELSGVPLRQIQLFEQRQRNINHTKAIDVVKFARVLGCKTEDLLQI